MLFHRRIGRDEIVRMCENILLKNVDASDDENEEREESEKGELEDSNEESEKELSLKFANVFNFKPTS